jgi:hypothetical protein
LGARRSYAIKRGLSEGSNHAEGEDSTEGKVVHTVLSFGAAKDMCSGISIRASDSRIVCRLPPSAQLQYCNRMDVLLPSFEARPDE